MTVSKRKRKINDQINGTITNNPRQSVPLSEHNIEVKKDLIYLILIKATTKSADSISAFFPNYPTFIMASVKEVESQPCSFCYF